MAEIIKNPEYIDLEKTRVRFTLVTSAGVESQAELTVPPNKQRGVNKYWDRIMDEFDIEEMRHNRNRLELEMRREAEYRREKEKASAKMIELRTLFDAKAKAFELPFIKEADIDTKSAVRRAPNINILTLILNDITQKFMKDTDMDWNDYLDYLDDLEDNQ